eukprot:12749158-Alexandrium_andersonii.AAC.1
MSASLVGSEMCIRDSSTAVGLATGVVPSAAGAAGPDAAAFRASSSAISLLGPPSDHRLSDSPSSPGRSRNS